MKMTELFAAELEREAPASRRVLERVPDGKGDWKPHEKSMPLGYLAGMVATMPSWLTMIIKQASLDLQPKDGKKQPPPPGTSRELVKAFDDTLAGAREALAGTTDEYLLTTRWQLLVAETVVSDTLRHEMLRDSINHMVHHRGQLTVYLRLLGASVPSTYGPSADEGRFEPVSGRTA
jgi:uncharacterized damage-inducible protein DinB